MGRCQIPALFFFKNILSKLESYKDKHKKTTILTFGDNTLIKDKKEEVHTTPLDLIGADTQGSIGYMIAQTLRNELNGREIEKLVAVVSTQVLVDKNDPGFENSQRE